MTKNIHFELIGGYKRLLETIRGCLRLLDAVGGHLEGNNHTCTFIRYLEVGKVKKVIRGAGHEKALVFVLNGVEIVVVEDNLRVVTAPIRETLAKLGSLVGPLKKSVQTFFVVQVQLWQHHLPKYGLVWPIRK